MSVFKKIDTRFLCAFAVLFCIETAIAIFVRDKFIRPYFGDVLVVVLIYFFLRVFIHRQITLLPLYIFLFAVAVELGQYFRLPAMLGLHENQIAGIIVGTSFDWKDIVCYFAGCAGIYLCSIFSKNKSTYTGREKR